MHVYPFLLRVAAMLEDSGHLLIFPNYTIPSTQLHGPDEARTVQLTLDYLLVLLPKTQRADARKSPDASCHRDHASDRIMLPISRQTSSCKKARTSHFDARTGLPSYRPSPLRAGPGI